MGMLKDFYIKKNFPMANYGVYEQDIRYFGGSVTYLGNILAQSKRSKVEEAIVSIDGMSCNVYMERFRDGSAVILYFVKDGVMQGKEVYPESKAVMYRLFDLFSEDDHFFIYRISRKLKQIATLCIQIIYLIAFTVATYMLWYKEFSIPALLMYISSPILIVMWGKLYKYYRLEDITTYKSIFHKWLD